MTDFTPKGDTGALFIRCAALLCGYNIYCIVFATAEHCQYDPSRKHNSSSNNLLDSLQYNVVVAVMQLSVLTFLPHCFTFSFPSLTFFLYTSSYSRASGFFRLERLGMDLSRINSRLNKGSVVVASEMKGMPLQIIKQLCDF